MSVAANYTKPLPAINASTAPHWEGARAGRLCVQKCKSCGKLRYPPNRWCAECRSDQSEWVDLSGRGKIWSWCIFHRLYFKGFENEMPYAVVLVELDEGVRLYSNLVGVAHNDIRIGMRVRAEFEPATDEVTLVKFKEDK